MYALLSTIVALLPLVTASPLLAEKRSISTCQAMSSSGFEWGVTDFVYRGSYTFSTPAHQISGGTVNFNLTNPAVETTSHCSAYSTQLDDFFYGNVIYTCNFPNGALSFTYDEPSSVLKFNNTWSCYDLSTQ